jgi:hypothetical protein
MSAKRKQQINKMEQELARSNAGFAGSQLMGMN